MTPGLTRLRTSRRKLTRSIPRAVHCGWNGLYFGGTAFKKQRPVDPKDYARAASIAGNHMDVVTTSGIATGQSADLGKLDQFREALTRQAHRPGVGHHA